MGLLLPDICAWCGTREKKGSYGVELSFRVAPRVKRTWNLSLPICDPCRDFVYEKVDAERKTNILTGVISAVIALLIVVFFLEYKSFLVTVGVTWLITFLITAIVMSVTGLTRKIEDRMTGPRPEGYASKSSDPCTMVGPEHLSFHHEEYHRQFANRNPSHVKW